MGIRNQRQDVQSNAKVEDATNFEHKDNDNDNKSIEKAEPEKKDWIEELQQRYDLAMANKSEESSCWAALRECLTVNLQNLNALEMNPSSSETLGKREKVEQILDGYIQNHDLSEDPTILPFLTELPEWLQRNLLLQPTVQHLLNDKIALPGAAVIIILDFIFLVLMLVGLQIVASKIKEEDEGWVNTILDCIPLLLSAIFLALRHVLCILSFLRVGRIQLYFQSPKNRADMLGIGMSLTVAILAMKNETSSETLKILVSLAIAMTWACVVVYFRTFSLDFCGFVAGLWNALPNLLSALLLLLVCLIAFAQLFWVSWDDASDFWTTMLQVYTMSVGEVDYQDFRDTPMTEIWYSLFIFLVIVLLANVIAYLLAFDIRQHRNASEFWMGRLYLSSEAEQLTTSIYNCIPALRLGCLQQNWEFLKKHWTQTLESPSLCEFFIRLAVRLVIALVIIPLWFSVGLITAGWLWPLQWRRYLLAQRVSTTETAAVGGTPAPAISRSPEHLLRENIVALQTEVEHWKEKAVKADELSEKLDKMYDIMLTLQKSNDSAGPLLHGLQRKD